MCIDFSLQAYFVYLVRANLVANGLTKYRHLFRVNLSMVFLSILMDVGKSDRGATQYGHLLSPSQC